MRHLLICAALVMASPAIAAETAMPMRHGGTPAEAANAAAMDTMMKAMDVKPTGDPDKDFARTMLAHHQGAIAMAKVELQYGKDPTMRTLATNIIAAQEKEIAEMRDWLAHH